MRRTPTRRLRMVAAVVALPAIAALGLVGCKPPVLQAACNGTLLTSTAGPLTSPKITEISGIASSRQLDGLFWVHNDSGNDASVYTVGAQGVVLGEYPLVGATNVDWEDIAIGPGPNTSAPWLYVADIGDNAKSRANVVVYRAPEPAVGAAPGDGSITPETLTFTYPDGPHDAEAFMVDPVSGQLFIVTKAAKNAQVFRAPANLAAGSTTALTLVATIGFGYLPAGITGADISPQGDTVALRSYLNVFMYQRPKDQPLEAAFSQQLCLGATPGVGTAPNQEPLLTSEAIGFTRDGKGYVTIAEGTNPYLHFFIAP